MPQGPFFQVVPSLLRFSAAGAVGQFTIENLGDTPLEVTSIKLVGHHASTFELNTGNGASTVPAGGKSAVSVRARYGGNAVAVVVVTTNSGEQAVGLILQTLPVGPHAPNPSATGQGEQPPAPGDPNAYAPGGTWTPGDDIDGGGCFARGTWVLMADGEAQPIESLVVGDMLLAVAERAHLDELTPSPAPARVEAVLRHEEDHALLDVGGIHATAVHRWAVRRDDAAGFSRTSRLVPGVTPLRALDGGTVDWLATPAIREVDSPAPVWNLETTAHTYLVGARPSGPFYVVHNAKKTTTDDSGSGGA